MIELGAKPLTLEDVERAAREPIDVRLSAAAREKVAASRRVVEQAVRDGKAVYGVNTGFGKLSDVRIKPEDLRALQLNLVRSHSCGVGEPLALGYRGAGCPRR